MIARAALSALLLGFALPAQADTLYDSCIAGTTTNSDWAACGWAWVDREDARLNRIWKSAYADLPPASKAALLAEQRVWIAYKDKSCLWHASGDWGREGQVLDTPMCRAGVIAARTDYLEHLDSPGEDEMPK